MKKHMPALGICYKPRACPVYTWGICINITCHDIIISMPFAMLMQMPNSGYCGTSTPPCRFNASCCKYQSTFGGLSGMVKAAV